MNKMNNGAPGIDGMTFEAIEAAGVESFLQSIQLLTKNWNTNCQLFNAYKQNINVGKRCLRFYWLSHFKNIWIVTAK
jgi:hypothetical protein